MCPKRIIIPFDFNQEIFTSPCINGNRHNYNELFKQIFDVMTTDFAMFTENVKKLPNLNNFILEDKNFDNNQILFFKEQLLHHAVNIWFTCFNLKLFSNITFDYILENVYQDYFILYYVQTPRY
jgi:hypothetical protein